MKRVINGSNRDNLRDILVALSWAGYLGTDEEAPIYADPDDIDSAVRDYVDEHDLLTVTEVENVEDDLWEVTINWAGYLGADEVYPVYADDAETAESLALDDAREDVRWEVLDDEDEE